MPTDSSRSGQLASLREESPYPGIVRRTIQGSHHTMLIYEFEPGAAFPMHRHDEEQTTVVVSGEVEFIAEDGTARLRAGDWSRTPPRVPHRVIAGPEGARIIAVVAPARERYEVVDER